MNKKLLLKASVAHLGEPGDIVSVKPGYARNYLLPKGYAVQATASNLKSIEHEIGRLRAVAAEKRAAAEAIAKQLAGVTLTMHRKVADPNEGSLYGSVSVQDIGEALDELGYTVDKGEIHLDHPIKNLGEYSVPVTLAHGVRGKVNVQVLGEEGEVAPVEIAEDVANDTAAAPEAAASE